MFSAATKTGSQPSAAANYIEDVFSTYLYTGNGSTQTITNNIDLAGKGGMTWIKSRSSAENNIVFDTNAQLRLITNLTNAGGSGFVPDYFNFNSNGFFLDAAGGSGYNTNNTKYCSWTFRKQPKFFDVVTYTGDGSTASREISHNLGSNPGAIIVKPTSATGDWKFTHRNGAVLLLNSTEPRDTSTTLAGGFPAQNGATTFTLEPYSGDVSAVNANGVQYVAYLFAHNAGGFGLTGTDNVISCGAVTTTAADYVDVNLGYEPQYVLFKTTNGTGPWYIVDIMRQMSQTTSFYLRANASNAEGNFTVPVVIPTATGFSLRSASYFGEGVDFIYMAIRRPMKVPTDATTVFSPNTSADSLGTPITTNFAIDSQLICYRNGSIGTNSNFNDRLRGNSSTTTSSGNLLVTSNANAEISSNVTRNWGNTEFEISDYYQASSTIYWNFARRPGFFDVVCYTGTGSLENFFHNLGVAPELMIIKSRSATYRWVVYNQSLGADKYLNLNTTDTPSTNYSYFNGTSPTSSQFTVYDAFQVNEAGTAYVAYLFATCPGVSKVGSYTGNGSTQAISCGFTGGARFVLIKRTDSTGDWYVYDTARGMTTLIDPYLRLNSTAAESATLGSVTTTAGGFTVDASILAAINTNGGSYIFLAIA